MIAEMDWPLAKISRAWLFSRPIRSKVRTIYLVFASSAWPRLLTVEVASPQTALAGLSCSQPTLIVQLTLLLALFARQSSDYLRKENNDNICLTR